MKVRNALHYNMFLHEAPKLDVPSRICMFELASLGQPRKTKSGQFSFRTRLGWWYPVDRYALKSKKPFLNGTLLEQRFFPKQFTVGVLS